MTDVENTTLKLPAPSDASDVQVSPYVRKAPYQFGWDFGPRLLGCGIWAPIELHAFEDPVIRYVKVVTEILEDDSVVIKAKIHIETQKEEVVWLRTIVGNRRDSLRVLFDPGERTIILPIRIHNPQLWWPNGYGDQKLYELTVEIEGRDHITSYSQKFGIRSVELLQNEDTIGQEFTFKVNGLEIFMKGANMVPLSIFPSEVTKQQTEQILDQVLAANMNMIRIWGGGIYGSDDLYQLCDEKGIMVWQDFMFASSTYSITEGYQANVQEEVIQQVRRISKHPSLMLWCGNNEVDVAWKNWGWQKEYSISPVDSATIWDGHKQLFEELIPRSIEEYDPNTPYIHTSPLSNWGRAENFNFGDMHYWGVWHGEEPIDHLADNVGRFMSEYGVQSYPNWSTIETYTDTADRYVGSHIFDHHQKSYKGDRLILEMVQDRYGEPKDAKALVHLSQILQAEAMTIAIDAHRLNFPHCMGSLYWQLNAVWPGPSWSTIDHSGQWKAAQYHIKEAFRPNVVLYELDGEDLSIYVRIEDPRSKDALIEVVNYPKTQADPINSSYSLTLSGNGLYKVADIKVNDVFGNNAIHKMPISIDLKVNNELLDRTVLIERKRIPNDNRIEVQMKVKMDEEGWTITLNTNSFVPWVIIETSTLGHFSDNYFHLLPGEEKVVHFMALGSHESPVVEFSTLSLEDLIK